MKRIPTYLPVFPGFYSTFFDAGGDVVDACPDECREMLDAAGCKDIPTHDFLEVADFDYSKWSNDYSVNLVCAVATFLKGVVHGLQGMSFERVASPRYYNFENDSIDVGVLFKSVTKFRTWWKEYLNEHSEEWKAFLNRRYSSRDGFIPSYPSEPELWKRHTVDYTQVDGHYLGAMLDFVCAVEGFDSERLYYASESPLATDYCKVVPKLVEKYRETHKSVDNPLESAKLVPSK